MIIGRFKIDLGQSSILAPMGSKTLSCRIEKGIPVVYVACTKETINRRISFLVVASGADSDVPSNAKFIGSVEDQDNTVWHFFSNR